MKLIIKNDLLNDLVLHHIIDVDSKDRYIISKRRQENKGWKIISKIIHEGWKDNKEIKKEIDYIAAYDKRMNLDDNALFNSFSDTSLVVDCNGEAYAYSNGCDEIRIYDFWDLLRMFPRELANLFEWGYIELADVDSDTNRSIKKKLEEMKPKEKAFEILSLAALMECSEVYPYLGDCYKDGAGTDANLMAAYKCYREASRLGDALGKLRLGEMYMNGLYIEKSYNAALYLFTEAALLGSVDAIVHLAEIYRAEDFNRRDEYMSLIYAEAGAKHGSDVCKMIAGDYYLNNARNEDEKYKAYEYYNSMTECKEKYHALGHYFEIAKGEVQINKCTGCYGMAINLGDKEAAYELARIYSADTVYKNLEQAKEFYNTYLKMGGKEKC